MYITLCQSLPSVFVHDTGDEDVDGGESARTDVSCEYDDDVTFLSWEESFSKPEVDNKSLLETGENLYSFVPSLDESDLPK